MKTERPHARYFYMFATIVGFLGCAVAILLAVLAQPGPADALPAFAAAFAFTLAIAGWLHEGDWRWKTAEAIVLAACALAIQPVFAEIAAVGWGIVVIAVVAAIAFVFS